MNIYHRRKANVNASFLAILLLAPVFGPLFTPTVKANRTWTVDDDGNADFNRIQDAIGRASDGDTILVYTGIYNEQVFVSKSLNIIGQDDGNTVIDGNNAPNAVIFAGNGIIFSGFTVKNAGQGLRIVGNGNDISSNFILQNDLGVVLEEACSGNSLSGNKIVLSTTYGIYGDRCGQNSISNNEISFNDWQGIFLYASKPCVIENNTVSSNGLDGVRLRYSSNNTVTENTFSANRIGLCIYSDEDPIRPGTLSRFNMMENNTFSNNACGIKIEHVGQNLTHAENVVRKNLIINNDVGLNISGSNGNVIYNNNFVNNSNQASVVDSFENAWNADYYLGGNYWSGHNSTDVFWGAYQNETGSDGVVDAGYIVNGNLSAVDLFPFSRQDGWFEDIELEILSPVSGMYRTDAVALILDRNKPVSASYILDDQGSVIITGNTVLSNLSIGTHNVTIAANDSLNNVLSLGVTFTVTYLADITLDGVVNIIDIAVVAYSFGTSLGDERWNPDADLNRDGSVNIIDISKVAVEFDRSIAVPP